ncbi:MAG: hypothetical protein R2789_13545 [Microthrixaceae bacterium]
MSTTSWTDARHRSKSSGVSGHSGVELHQLDGAAIELVLSLRNSMAFSVNSTESPGLSITPACCSRAETQALLGPDLDHLDRVTGAPW